jgi:prevent-host-death family protein
MQTISSSDARNNLAAMLDKAQHEPIAIQKQGRTTAVLVSYEEYERLTNASVAAFQAICDTVGAKAKSRGLTEAKLAKLLAKQ